NLQTSLEDYGSSINSYNAVLSFNDKSSKAYYGVGNVLYKQKQYQDAVGKLKLAVQYNPDYDSAWNALGLAQEKTNNLSEAVESFNNAIKSTKKRSRKGSYYYRLGNVQVKLRKFNDAEKSYKEALKFSKSQNIVGGTNFGLGEVYKALGQKQNAIKAYEKASKNRAWKASADYEIDLLKNPDKYTN
ncbi:MAG: tetratricopeptide repeat protein, partial [Calditrichia bacterium]|nr:tetratricopeptide repeat protein [Calditrichia bacterium]